MLLKTGLTDRGGVAGVEPGLSEVVLFTEALQIKIGEYLGDPAQLGRRRVEQRQSAAGIFEGVAGQHQLFETVLALHPPACLPGTIDGRQQQADERADDGNHDQELDERKTT